MNLILLFGLIASVSGVRNNETSGLHRVTHIAWLDITTAGVYLGRIEIGLFGRVVPITVRNFVNLANRPKGKGYKGSKIYRINRNNELIAAGDWISGTGNEGQSSFNTPEFENENFKLKHYGAGWLAADPYDKDQQTSLFIITLRPVPRLDGICVVFGKVVKGMNVVRKIGKVPVDERRKPLTDVVISDCGAELADPPFFTPETDATD